MLKAGTILDQRITIKDVSSRNVNFQVNSDHHCYMIKQGIDSETRIAINREADFYRYVYGQGDKRLANILPELYYFDPEQCILITEMIPEAENARFYYLRTKNFSTRLTSRMGYTLGILHSCTQKDHPSTLNEFKSSHNWKTPHYLGLNAFRRLSSASMSVMNILHEYPEFSRVFQDIHKNWKEDAIIHNDIRFDNFLFYGHKNSKKKVKVIDLELVCLGDPRWDIASIFGEFLLQWILLMPVVPDLHPQEYMKMAVYKIQSMRPAMRSFWDTYNRTREFEDLISNQFLLSSMSYLSMKLINSAFEVTHTLSKISNNVICLLQLSSNIFRRPADAIRNLLGITVT